MNEIKCKVHCNSCGRITSHFILLDKEKRWSDEQYPISGADIYQLVECCGCESIRLIHKHWFSEDCEPDGSPIIHENFYPPSLFRPLPKWIHYLDEEWGITKLIKETYSALQNNSPSLALMGIRAIIESIMIDKIGDQKSFKRNLEKFLLEGYISNVQKDVLNRALEAGHASIHRGFIPESIHVDTCMDICENLIEILYVIHDRSVILERDVPSK